MEDDNKEKISEIVNDDILIEGVQNQVLLLDPVCEAINKCQGKDTTLSDGAETWLKLSFPDSCTAAQKKILDDRKEMALTDIALAAYYIDPFKDNNLLSSSQRQAGRSFISNRLSENLRDQLIQYESNEGTFNEIKEATDCSKDFWFFAESQVPNLAIIARKLSQIPASTAQLERSFNMWKNIHSKLRNRLGFERSKILMMCYYHFANMKKYGKNNVLDYI